MADKLMIIEKIFFFDMRKLKKRFNNLEMLGNVCIFVAQTISIFLDLQNLKHSWLWVH